MKGGTAPPGKLCWFIWGEERRGEERRGEEREGWWDGGREEERRGEEEKKKKVEVRRDRKGKERSRKVS